MRSLDQTIAKMATVNPHVIGASAATCMGLASEILQSWADRHTNEKRVVVIGLTKIVREAESPHIRELAASGLFYFKQMEIQEGADAGE
jgi:chaperonin GroEL (HSP60 family)